FKRSFFWAHSEVQAVFRPRSLGYLAPQIQTVQVEPTAETDKDTESEDRRGSAPPVVTMAVPSSIYQISSAQFAALEEVPAFQIEAATASAVPQGILLVSSESLQNTHQLSEDAIRKRELRLRKNREAARECRRKKKEYIKCLENRVAVLEIQNKTLLEELNSLKDLYCHKAEDTAKEYQSQKIICHVSGEWSCRAERSEQEADRG
ncbi:cAMP-responsive element modulator, partial [Galemys pyrenaicus]